MTFSGLEGLRGLMCFWVILSHTVTMAGFQLYKHEGVGKLVANGGIAVDVFVILSGFVICLIIKTKKESYIPFIARRALRLFPVYVVCLLVSILIADLSVLALQNMPFEHAKTLRRLEIFSNYFEQQYLHTFLHFLLIHGVIPDSTLADTAYTIMGQAWSLTLEFQFYLIAPFILILIYSSKLNLMVTLIGLALVESALQGTFGHNSFFFAYSHFFAIGILSYVIFENFTVRQKSNKNFLIASAGLFILSIVYIKIKGNWLSVAGLIIWIVVYYIEYFTDNGRYSSITKILNLVTRSKLMLYFGKISYSMYCSHMIFLYLCSYLATSKDLGLNFSALEYMLFMTTVPVLATVLFSSVSYKVIEKPFINLGKRLFLLKR